MLGARLRRFALVCIVLPVSAVAQESTSAQFIFPSNAGQLYEASQSDVTVPIASYDVENGANAPAVMIPVENLATPMRCMTAWSYLAARAIEDSETMSNLHSDFTEATASAHWQH